jgi:hypothetical protein
VVWSNKAREAVQALRGICNDLRPPLLQSDLISALRALAAWTNSGPMCGRRVVIRESYTRDRPFYRVKLDSVYAEHSDLGAAIMDALGKANANRAA